jgi:hypothetical protein
MKKVVFFILLLFPAVCFAEPTPTVRYLMEEKLSIFDAGMIELNKIVEGFCEFYKDIIVSYFPDLSKTFPTTGSSTYVWDENKIIISIVIVLDKKPTDEKILKEFSKMIFEALQTNFLIDKRTGKPINPIFDNISELFSHQGYQKKNEPSTLQSDLHNIIYVTLAYGINNSYAIFFKANAKLYGTEIFFSK